MSKIAPAGLSSRRLTERAKENAMRWVILFALIAMFLIWDGMYNSGHYLDVFVRWVFNLGRMVGLT